MRTLWLIGLALAGAVVALGARGLAQDAEEPRASKATILEIVHSRAVRLPEIDTYKAAGVIGENNRGLVEVIDLEPIEDDDAHVEIRGLVDAENADREQLYRTLAAEGPGEGASVSSIRARYAQIMRAAARPGDWIQGPDGAWKKKKKAGG